METYENSFFRPKPRKEKCAMDEDCPCLLDAFACTERWWESNIKAFIDVCKKEYDKDVEIDTDDLESKHTVDVTVDGKYVITAKSKEEVAVAMRSIYSMLTICVAHE